MTSFLQTHSRRQVQGDKWGSTLVRVTQAGSTLHLNKHNSTILWLVFLIFTLVEDSKIYSGSAFGNNLITWHSDTGGFDQWLCFKIPRGTVSHLTMCSTLTVTCFSCPQQDETNSYSCVTHILGTSVPRSVCERVRCSSNVNAKSE